MLKKLQTHHREVDRLRFEGYTPAQIAERLEMKLTTVRSVLNDPLCQGYINGLADQADTQIVDVRKRLISMNARALDRIEDMLDPDAFERMPSSVVYNAAKDTLDRTGYKPVERREHLHGHFTLDDLEKLKARRAKLAG